MSESAWEVSGRATVTRRSNTILREYTHVGLQRCYFHVWHRDGILAADSLQVWLLALWEAQCEEGSLGGPQERIKSWEELKNLCCVQHTPHGLVCELHVEGVGTSDGELLCLLGWRV